MEIHTFHLEPLKRGLAVRIKYALQLRDKALFFTQTKFLELTFLKTLICMTWLTSPWIFLADSKFFRGLCFIIWCVGWFRKSYCISIILNISFTYLIWYPLPFE